MKEVNVKVDDDEILIRYKIDEGKMNRFYEKVTHCADTVCGCPLFDKLSEEEQKMYAQMTLEDSILGALDEIPSTGEILVSPIRIEKYLNGEYEVYNTTYLCRELLENAGKLVGYKYKEGDEFEVKKI